MAKSRPSDARAATAELPGGYFVWSRDPAMGLFAVLPLWLLYVVLRWRLAPAERNGAELLLLQELGRFGSNAHLVLSAAFLLLTIAAAVSLWRREVPWLRVASVIAIEGTIYALLLGPIASQLTAASTRFLSLAAALVPSGSLAADVVGSIGAGIFEELVFRLGLMSALVFVALRVARGWSLPAWTAGAFAVVVSALVFSWFHHLCGEPFEFRTFVFRTMAGVLLGLLMWARGYGVCVYTHAIYNVYYYVSRDGP